MPIRSRLQILAAEKALRDGKKKLTFREISEGTGLPVNTITRYMTQTVTRFEAETLEAFCIFFECNVGDLLTYVPPAKK